MSQNELMASAGQSLDEIQYDNNNTITNSSSQSVVGSPGSSSSKMSLTAAAVAAASASHSHNHHHRGDHLDHNNHNQWEVVSSSSTSSSVSRMNSMECWDYTIELECLQGPEGGYSIFMFLQSWAALKMRDHEWRVRKDESLLQFRDHACHAGLELRTGNLGLNFSLRR